jgi:hypothetical protein
VSGEEKKEKEGKRIVRNRSGGEEKEGAKEKRNGGSG